MIDIKDLHMLKGDSNHAVRKTTDLLQMFKREVSDYLGRSPNLAPNDNHL